MAPLVAAGLMMAEAADAQGVFRASPSFSLTQQYDSNVFSTSTDPEADFVTRVSPGVESEYRTPLWTTTGRYQLDIERFADHAELNSMDARQRAAVALDYRPTPRVAWAVGAEFWKTRTPGELNETSGLTFTRAAARRLSAHSSVTRHLTPLTSGKLDYSVTQDRLAGRTAASTQDAAAGVERHRSTRETVSLDYHFREFAFVPHGAPASRAMSHAVTLGWTRAVTSRMRVSLAAGPRVTNMSAAPELSASIQYQHVVRDLSLTYARTQVTVIGLAGVADTQSLSARAAWGMWSSIRMRLTPAVFRSVLEGSRADAYTLTADLTRPIARGLALDVAVDAGVQRGSLYGRLANTTIARRGVLIRLVAGSSALLW
jgi:hypothetical protein